MKLLFFLLERIFYFSKKCLNGLRLFMINFILNFYLSILDLIVTFLFLINFVHLYITLLQFLQVFLIFFHPEFNFYQKC